MTFILRALSNLQFDFTYHRSPQDVINVAVNYITKAVERNSTCLAIFDPVQQEELLDVFERYGCQEHVAN